MKVLFGALKYPQLSETYVSAEIAFLVRSGIDVKVWAPMVRTSEAQNQVPVYRDGLLDAVRDFKPDIVHVHHMTSALTTHRSLEGLKIPMTVRAHSFDFSPSIATQVLGLANVERIYLFPHLARQVPHSKVVALPVAFDSIRYPGAAHDKDRRLALRLGAGLPTKRLGDFFRVAELCPEFRYVAGIASCDSEGHVAEELRRTYPKSRVSIFKNVAWDAAAQLTRRAGVFVHTYDANCHAFGMPISIAEALSTGSIVFTRDTMAAREFMGDAGLYYTTPDEVAGTMRQVLGWSNDQWARQIERSAMQAALYRDHVVLPRLIHDWEQILDRR